MTNDPLHLVFTGGGTGGHLFPGLAVAQWLRSEIARLRVTFVGSGKQFEHREVASAGFEYLALPCRPLPKRARLAFSFVVENLAGYLAAGRFLDQRHASAVVGLGGYASVPMARAAIRRNVPLVLLEQNAVPGRATRWLTRGAAVVCAGLAQTRANLRCRCPVRVTGTPIRKGGPSAFVPCESDARAALLGTKKVPARSSGPPQRQLLILGGSNGARAVNQSVPRALYKIGRKLAGWNIVHQSGPAESEATRRLYRKLGIEATVTGFIDRLPDVLAASDLAVSRAGGTTLAELSAAGLPAVLLPYPHATDDHQGRNAEAYTKAGGSLTLDHRRLSGRLDDHLADTISELLNDPGKRARMSAAMRRLARPNAADDVAAVILQLAQSRYGRPVPAAA